MPALLQRLAIFFLAMLLATSAAAEDPETLDDVIQQSVENSINDLLGGTEVVEAIYNNDLATLERLIKAGLDPNRPAKDPELPAIPLLFTAIEAEQLQVVRLLIRYNADVNARDPQLGISMLSQAAAMGSAELVDTLLKAGADPKMQDKWGGTALEEAAYGGSKVLVERFRSLGLKTQWPLHVAAGIGDVEALRRLLETAEDIDQPTPGWRNTPLMFATGGGQLETTKLLLEHGANPNLPNRFETFPIDNAISIQSKPLCQMLLKHGADINARAGQSPCPLEWSYEDGFTVYLQGLGAKPTDWDAAAPTIDDWWKKPNANLRAKD